MGGSPAEARIGTSAWRLLDTGAAPGEFNLALDEALFSLAGQNGTPPTVRFYRWSPPAVSVGYFQRWEDQIDAEACERAGFRVLRRITGGRAVLHRDEVTYSVVCPDSEGLFGRGLRRAYNGIARALAAGLRRVGIDAEVAPPARKGQGRLDARHPSCFAATAGSEISVGGRKLVGSAQKRQGGSMLQHGSILLAGHGDEFEAILKPRRRSGDPAPPMTSLEDVLGFRPEPSAVVASLVEGFEDAWGTTLLGGVLTGREKDLAEGLVRSKYTAADWNGPAGHPRPAGKGASAVHR